MASASVARFHRCNIHRYTWYSNDEQTAKEIDHVLVNTRWNVVQQCRVYRSMNTDHRAVVATITIKLRTAQKKPLHPPAITSTNYYKNPELQQSYAVEAYSRFSALSEEEQELQDQWPTFRDEVNDAAKAVLGFTRPSKNDWLTSKTLDIIGQKRAARLSGNMPE